MFTPYLIILQKIYDNCMIFLHQYKFDKINRQNVQTKYIFIA